MEKKALKCFFQNISSWTSLVYESDNYKHDFYQTLVLVSVALKASVNHSQQTEKYFPWKLINLEAYLLNPLTDPANRCLG